MALPCRNCGLNCGLFQYKYQNSIFSIFSFRRFINDDDDDGIILLHFGVFEQELMGHLKYCKAHVPHGRLTCHKKQWK
jgi:hypothetical protein